MTGPPKTTGMASTTPIVLHPRMSFIHARVEAASMLQLHRRAGLPTRFVATPKSIEPLARPAEALTMSMTSCPLTRHL